MTAPDEQHGHAAALTADPADRLMALLTDAKQALDALHQGFAEVTCPGCRPDDTEAEAHAEQVGADLLERYGADLLEADFLLAQTADARSAMKRVLQMPDCHHHDDEGDVQ